MHITARMHITMVGAGAVGGYFGGRMAEAGLDVTFLVRNNRAEYLREHGLSIESPLGDVRLPHVKVAVHPYEIELCDLIIVAVKNYHLEETIDFIQSLVDKGAKVLPLLNGVEHYDLFIEAFGSDAVIGGLCQVIATLDQRGKIIHTSSIHDMVFGALEPSQQPICDRLHQELSGVKFSPRLKDQIWRDIWYKYMFITAYSGVTTAVRLPINGILACSAAQEVLMHAFSEMSHLAKAKGLQIAPDFVERTMESMHQLPKGSTSSMHQDFTKGLPLEVESLQGGALRAAAKIGMALPTIRTLYGIIKPYERGTLH